MTLSTGSQESTKSNLHWREDRYIDLWKEKFTKLTAQIFLRGGDYNSMVTEIRKASWIQKSEICTHDYQVVEAPFKNGAINYRNQCSICGEVTNFIKHSDVSAAQRASASIPFVFDNEYVRVRQQKIVDVYIETVNKKRIDNFRSAHEKYLQSPVWRSKRELVLRRAGGICEGCQKEKATEVHHLNYKGWPGNELLYNLVALCRECHAEAERQEGRKHE